MFDHVAKSKIGLVPPLFLAALLSGCGGSSDDRSNPTPPAVGQTANQIETVAPGDGPRFGQAATWDSGLVVMVSAPEEYAPSATASVAGEDGTPVRLSITVTNNTGKLLSSFSQLTSLRSGGMEAEKIFDAGAGIDGGMQDSDLPDGNATTWTEAFLAADPEDIEFTYQPQFLEGEQELMFDPSVVVFTN
jgi:hypothetical protein